MEKIQNKELNIPLEFRVACALTKIEIHEVLQVFIDHVSVYNTLNNVYSDGFTECSGAIALYIIEKDDQSEHTRSFAKCSLIANQCLRKIIQLAKKSPNEVEKNRKQIQPQVAKLFNAMEHIYAPANQILVEGSTVHLNQEFCILCEMHKCQPNEYLEHFMQHISLAETHAREDLKAYVQNFPLAAFLKIVNSLRKNVAGTPDRTTLDLEFYQNAKELRLSLFNIRDLEERIKILRDYYLSYYKSINPK